MAGDRMTLTLPSEIVVERFLPTARAMLATELADAGLSQQAIATKLGLSQAAVSKYLSGEQTGDPRFADNEQMQATIQRIATGIADGEMGDYEALAELLELVREFEDRGPICAAHEEEMPTLEGLGCDLCVRGSDSRAEIEREVLRNVQQAVRLFANDPVVVDHIPNVGTNVGMALPDVGTTTDVAAIPGRVHAMGGRVNVPADPEFGASEHVATAIRAVMAVDPDRRGALNLRTSDDLLAAAEAAGLTTAGFDASYEDRAERLTTVADEREAVPEVLYHEGAFGIEPITYVFGETATDAVETARDLLAAIADADA
jgi:predicted fused transcriptional regulator/phosphomethylpyrimidine kinase/predicted transcriptional regulator